MPDKFEWNDDLVKECSTFLMNAFNNPNSNNSGKWEGVDVELGKWKNKKAKEKDIPKPDWEILSFIDKITYFVLPVADIPSGYAVSDYLSPHSSFNIHSVKRLSDNSVWTIGDKFWANAGCDLTIKSFQIIKDDWIKVWSKEYGYWKLNEINKPKIPFITTEEGIKVYDESQVIYIAGMYDGSMHMWAEKAISCANSDDTYKFFHSEINRLAWVNNQI